MSKIRRIKSIMKSQPKIEGAGVHLKRAFGEHNPSLDPFLLLDDFHSHKPKEYMNGFPWHPHRGIETITYMINGEIEHGDNLGNKGTINSGDVQWMTAGSGIIHQEMPKNQNQKSMWGFQLWANLPASNKMVNPKYRDVNKNQIPKVELDNGTKIKIIAGEINGVSGPVNDVTIKPEYFDVTIPPNSSFNHHVKRGHNVFAYVIDGSAYFDPGLNLEISEINTKTDIYNDTCFASSENLIIYGDGENISIKTKEKSTRFLLISGKPIHEPVAWYGPIVMNTQNQLLTAFKEYKNGTFIKNNTLIEDL